MSDRFEVRAEREHPCCWSHLVFDRERQQTVCETREREAALICAALNAFDEAGEIALQGAEEMERKAPAP